MALLRIPIRNDIFKYRETVSLDGTDYTLAFELNDRTQEWYFSIVDLLEGQKIVHGHDILAQYNTDPNLPPGKFHVIDPTGSLIEPNKTNFSETHILIYEEVGTV